MLRINQEQCDIFNRLAEKRFEDRMYAYLATAFPDRCRQQGEPEARKTIRAGLERARSHSVVLENDVARYIELMYVWSPEFDKDPALPWAEATLKDQRLTATEKVDTLWNRTEALMQAEPGTATKE